MTTILDTISQLKKQLIELEKSLKTSSQKTEASELSYYEKNKEKIKAREEVYRSNNKDKKKEQDRQRYLKNKSNIMNKVKCDCGGTFNKTSKATHLKSKKHISFMNR